MNFFRFGSNWHLPKNSYIMNQFILFLKTAGICISVFLLALCLKLFLQNPRYLRWYENKYFTWIVISGIAVIGISFLRMIFCNTKINNVCLFDMYLLFGIKCSLFMFILKTTTTRPVDIVMMRWLILGLGILFMFLEFLHTQTANNFIRDRRLLSGIMGIVSCLLALRATVSMNWPLFEFTPFCISYLFYALWQFIFSLWKSEKYKLLPKAEWALVIFLLLLSPLACGMMLGMSPRNRIEEVAIMETWVVFGCAQLIPSKEDSRKNAAVKISMSILTLAYFAALSLGGSAVWVR
jgi:hypothetical protein